MLTPEEQNIQEKILYDHGGMYGLPENFGIRVMFSSEIERLLTQEKIEISKHRISKKLYLILADLEYLWRVNEPYFFLEEIDDKKMSEGFATRPFNSLCEELELSNRGDWEENKIYYLALYDVVNSKFEELNIPIGETYLT